MIIKDLLDGITNAIYEEFGDDYEIYTSRVTQGLNEPCFIVRCLNPMNNLALGNISTQTRRETTTVFAIQYFPTKDDSEEIYIEFDEVFERLVSCLEFITVSGDLVRGYDFSSDESDGVMTFYATYSVPLIVKVEETEMLTLRQEEGVDNG